MFSLWRRKSFHKTTFHRFVHDWTNFWFKSCIISFVRAQADGCNVFGQRDSNVGLALHSLIKNCATSTWFVRTAHISGVKPCWHNERFGIVRAWWRQTISCSSTDAFSWLTSNVTLSILPQAHANDSKVKSFCQKCSVLAVHQTRKLGIFLEISRLGIAKFDPSLFDCGANDCNASCPFSHEDRLQNNLYCPAK